MALARQVVQPSPTLVRLFVESKLKEMLPVGYQWFDPRMFRTDKELGQFLEGLVSVLADMAVQAKTLKYATTLDSAFGVLLDQLGGGYGITRQVAESDDDYAIRIQQELLIKRITRPAIEEGLLQFAEFVELYEPWRDLPIPSVNWVLSGAQPLGSPDYYNAAVFDAFLWPVSGAIPGLDEFFEVMKAFGVKPWVTVNLPDQAIDFNDDPMLPQVVVPTLSNGQPDPRFVSRPNVIIGSTLELETDVVPGRVPSGFMLSRSGSILSGTVCPSGRTEGLLFTLDIVNELFDFAPAHELCTSDPIYIAMDEDRDNLLVTDDVDAGELIGSVVTVFETGPALRTTTRGTDLQGGAMIEQEF